MSKNKYTTTGICHNNLPSLIGLQSVTNINQQKTFLAGSEKGWPVEHMEGNTIILEHPACMYHVPIRKGSGTPCPTFI